MCSCLKIKLFAPPKKFSLIVLFWLATTWVVLKMCTWKEYVLCLTKHADLIHTCHSLIWGILALIFFEHVKGHQDNLQALSELPCISQLNIMNVDNIVKHTFCMTSACHNTSGIPNQPCLDEWWSCWTPQEKISLDLHSPILFLLSQ